MKPDRPGTAVKDMCQQGASGRVGVFSLKCTQHTVLQATVPAAVASYMGTQCRAGEPNQACRLPVR